MVDWNTGNVNERFDTLLLNLEGKDLANAYLFDPASYTSSGKSYPTNIPIGAVRFNSTNANSCVFEKFDGTSWNLVNFTVGNATTLQGRTVGREEGNIPVNDGVANPLLYSGDSLSLGGKSASSYATLSMLGNRNKLINGAFTVTQRTGANFTTALTSTPAYLVADRWQVAIVGGTAISGNAKVIEGQFASGLTSYNRVYALDGVTFTSGKPYFSQKIEKLNSLGFNGKQVTLSLKLYHTAGIPVNFSLRLLKPNASDNFTSTTLVESFSVDVQSGTLSPVQHTYTLGSADASNGLMVEITTTNAITVSNRQFAVADIQLEEGSVATPFECNHAASDLLQCLRYLEVSNFNFTSYALSGNSWGQKHTFLARKRALPTLSWWVASSSNAAGATLTQELDATASTAYAVTSGTAYWAGLFAASAEL